MSAATNAPAAEIIAGPARKGGYTYRRGRVAATGPRFGQRRRVLRPLILDELLQVHVGGEAAEHVAVLVGSHTLRHFCFWVRQSDKGGHLAVLDAADADTLPKRRVDFFTRLRVGDIDDVVADIDTARPAELLPFRQEFSILVENLDSAVGSVGDKQTAGGIHGETVGHVEFALCRSMVAPRFDEFAVLREFDDTVVRLRYRKIAMAVGDKNVAVGCDKYIGRRIECVGTVAGYAEFSERHQDSPVRRELHGGLVFPVGDPDRSVGSGEQAVRPTEQSGSEAHDEPARRIEFLDRRDVRAVAAFAAAAVEHPYARTVAIDVNADRHSPHAPLRKLGPIVDDVIRIRRTVGIVSLNPASGRHHGPDNGRTGEANTQHHSRAFAHIDSSLRITPRLCGAGVLCFDNSNANLRSFAACCKRRATPGSGFVMSCWIVIQTAEITKR